MPTRNQILFLLFAILVFFALAWASSGLSFSAWWAGMEAYNMSHFATGCVLGLLFWIIGLKWVQPKWGLKAGLFSFLGMAAFSVLIEWWQYSRGNASDGFSLLDLLWAGLGWVFGQAYHLATHKWDK